MVSLLFKKNIYTHSTWSKRYKSLLGIEHNSCYCHHIPILRIFLRLQSSCASAVLLSNTMGWNATFHSVHFSSTAQADFGNVGQYALLLHGIHTPGKYLGNRTISSNFSSTQYNPIVKAFLGARNVDIYCRQSRVRYCIHDWSKEHKCESFSAYSSFFYHHPYTENYMWAGGPRSADQSLWCHFRLPITYTVFPLSTGSHHSLSGQQKEGRAGCFAPSLFCAMMF